MEKGNKYANTASRISYLTLVLFVLGLLTNGVLGVIGLIACLVTYEYVRKAEKNGSTEFKKIKTAKIITGIIAGLSITMIILNLLIN